jgi:hypothetical protein
MYTVIPRKKLTNLSSFQSFVSRSAIWDSLTESEPDMAQAYQD